MKVLTLFGTRPEAIKMAPVIAELSRRPDEFEIIIVVSAQHREMLDQVLNVFEIKPDCDLDIMRESQSLSQITCNVLRGVEGVLEKEKPDIVLVQGDTTTTFTSALAAFYHRIPVGHIEAGLRTHRKYNPFPEELNRHLTSVIADLHFAPTELAKQNLLREGVKSESVYVTGNTVIDALLSAAKLEYEFKITSLASLDFNNSKIILVTAHRRENLGSPLKSICFALRELALSDRKLEIVFPVHLNPKVRSVVENMLSGIENIHLIEPLDYVPFVQLMKRAYLILTDSGGIQEEAPSLGKPVLVLRSSTERPEAIQSGAIKLVGTEQHRIVENVRRLLDDRTEYEQMACSDNPFGDGRASTRIADILLEWHHSK